MLFKRQEELKLAKQKAEENAKVKEEFLSVMSHEIRTPITAIIGMSDLVLKSNLSEKDKNYILTINRSSKKLLSIINNILDFAKLKKGKLELSMIEFDLYQLVSDVIELLKIKSDEKGLYINLHFQASKIVEGDNSRLSQILINLIGNAIKFTNKGGIDIYITQNGDIFRFKIKDSGIGIDEETQKKLFQSFSQADSSISRKYGGTGLGLAITKQFITLMNGKIWIESKKGEGATFIFEINLKNKGNIVGIKGENEKLEIKDFEMDPKLKNKLLELKNLLKTNQPRLVKPILNEIEKFELDSTIRKIVSLAKQYKFKEVIKILEQMEE